MTTTKPFQLGSISTGTLRTKDLLHAFRNALSRVGYNTHLELITEACIVIENENWEGEQALELVNDRLSAAINELCPPFVYFGAHPDDGADFGFWPDMNAIHESVDSDGYGGEVPGEYVLDNDGVIVQVDELNHITVMDRERQVL